MEDRNRLFRAVDAYPGGAHVDTGASSGTSQHHHQQHQHHQHQHQHHHHADHPTNLTAKPHAFAGAVLSPKHARDLTPSNCLQIASALAEQSQRRTVVPYTLWITEAWRVLGWAEPSAALFWEMATMYHTLYLAGRAFAADYENNNIGANSGAIPPILSCGSASSVGSGTTTHTPVTFDKKKFSSAASAKELPVWLVGTFLLLHCEEYAFWRNLSGKDDRRFYESGGGLTTTTENNASGEVEVVDFSSMLRSNSSGGSHASTSSLSAR